MQISHTLKKECHAETEIEFFLYIQQLSQAIKLATPKFEMLFLAGVDPSDIKSSLDIENAEDNLEKAVHSLNQFGLNFPAVKLKHLKVIYTLEFIKWYTWWEDYLGSLNDIELGDLEKSYLNGEDLSEWYPEGTWKSN